MQQFVTIMVESRVVRISIDSLELLSKYDENYSVAIKLMHEKIRQLETYREDIKDLKSSITKSLNGLDKSISNMVLDKLADIYFDH